MLAPQFPIPSLMLHTSLFVTHAGDFPGLCKRLCATADLCYSIIVHSVTGIACPSGIQLVCQAQVLKNAVRLPACTGFESGSRLGDALGHN